MQGTKGALVSACHIQIGVDDRDALSEGTLSDRWGQGGLELVMEYAPYGTLLDNICQAAATVLEEGFPGVFDYEVSEPFGDYFAHYVITNRVTPTRGECLRRIRILSEEFFEQAPQPDHAMIRAAIGQCIDNFHEA
jgi:hypothetical protein